MFLGTFTKLHACKPLKRTVKINMMNLVCDMNYNGGDMN